MVEMCRLCLEREDVMTPIFIPGSELLDQIKACLALQISADDNQKHICSKCNGRLRDWRKFKDEVHFAQKFLNSHSQFKTLHSSTVTSSAERRSSGDDVNRAREHQSPINAKHNHSSSHDFDGNIGFINKENPKDFVQSDGRCSVQDDPASAAVNPNAHLRSPHHGVSSSSGENAPGRKFPVFGGSSAGNQKNSTLSAARSDNEDDDAATVILEGPLKPNCPAPTVGSINLNKGKKNDPNPVKNTKNNISPSERGKLSPKPGLKSSPKPSPNSSEDRRRQHVKCPYCKDMLQISSLRNHITFVHNMDPRGIGSIQKYIKTQTKVKKSSPSGSKAVKTPRSPTTSKMANLSQIKKKVAGGLSRICAKCKRQLKNRATFVGHQKYCGTADAHLCPYCKQQFRFPGHVRRHIEECSKAGNTNKKPPKPSTSSATASTSYSNIYTSSSGAESETEIEIAKICSLYDAENKKLDTTKDAEVVAGKTSDGDLKAKTASDKPELTIPTPNLDSKTVKCQDCSNFFSPAAFPTHQCHQRRPNAPGPDGPNQEAPSGNQVLSKCPLCQAVVPEEVLRRHLQVVHLAF